MTRGGAGLNANRANPSDHTFTSRTARCIEACNISNMLQNSITPYGLPMTMKDASGAVNRPYVVCLAVWVIMSVHVVRHTDGPQALHRRIGQ